MAINNKFQDYIYIANNANKDVDWSTLCMHMQLSEEFIEDFQDKVDWGNISYYQDNISEDFIAKFQDKIAWQFIAQRRQLSNEFIRKYLHKLNITDILSKQKNLDADIREYLILLKG